jgi:hypothetical protein
MDVQPSLTGASKQFASFLTAGNGSCDVFGAADLFFMRQVQRCLLKMHTAKVCD